MVRFSTDETKTFDSFYDKDRLSFGEVPSEELRDYLLETGYRGRALDIGSGDGRNALFLAASGFDVTALDISPVGLRKLELVAARRGLESRVHTICTDVRQYQFPEDTFDLILAVTLFDHLPPEDLESVYRKTVFSLKEGGTLYAQSHTVDDPGFVGNGHASELAPMIHHYFAHNELLDLVRSDFRILWYQEKPEEDHSHGEPHQHAFAKILARKWSRH